MWPYVVWGVLELIGNVCLALGECEREPARVNESRGLFTRDLSPGGAAVAMVVIFVLMLVLMWWATWI